MNEVEVQRLGIGELAIAHNPHVLGCVGLGSCLAIAIYCPLKKLGGLAHVHLSQGRRGSRSACREQERPARHPR